MPAMMDDDGLRRLEVRIVDTQVRIAHQCLLIQQLHRDGHTAAVGPATELLVLMKDRLKELRTRRRVLRQQLRQPPSQQRPSSGGPAQRLRAARDARELIGAVAGILSEKSR
jgi:hypothetical protein